MIAPAFLNLPFYQTGTVRKNPITQADVAIVAALLEEVRPSMVFAAGDLSDPHGTHRMCLEAVERALERYTGDTPWLWLYRGAWQEWTVNEATVLVPLSEGELRAKVQAIFRHESQKDSAPFPGPGCAGILAAGRRSQPGHGRFSALAGVAGLPCHGSVPDPAPGHRVEAHEIPTASLAEDMVPATRAKRQLLAAAHGGAVPESEPAGNPECGLTPLARGVTIVRSRSVGDATLAGVHDSGSPYMVPELFENWGFEEVRRAPFACRRYVLPRRLPGTWPRRTGVQAT